MNFQSFVILVKTFYLERIVKNSLLFTVLMFLFSTLQATVWDFHNVDNHYNLNKFLFPPDSTETGDSVQHINLPYPIEQETFPYTGDESTNPLFLKPPSNIESDVIYDPETGQYILEHKIGDIEYRPPTYMTLDEYRNYDLKNSVNDYWDERAKAAGVGTRSGIIPSIYIGGKAFDKVFGGNTIDIRPSGSVELIFQVLGNSRDDPTIPVRQRKQVNFDFQEKIQMNVVAKIGDKIEFKTNYNTEATFEFENKLNLRYEGDEDEIIQLIEAGDVNLPLNSTLITGSQSLFGIKSKLKFGKTTVTAIFSEQESETSTITVQGGAQTNEFLFKVDEYEENKHFFLAQYFRDRYDTALSELPIINSNINITKIEVWVTNIGAAVTENRNLVAFTDIGEKVVIQSDLVSPSPPYVYPFETPDTRANNLFDILDDTAKLRNINTVNNYLLSKGFIPGQDYEKVELARKLNPNEYSYNSKLGFISLNSNLNDDQMLAVAFQYQLIGADSTVFQVGNFSDEGITGQSCLMVKLLKGTIIDINSTLWNLMMKNVYSLSAYQVNREDFTLNILYSGDESGVPTGFFEEGPFKGKSLINVFNFDNLDAQQNKVPTGRGDGVFDFIDNAATQGGTINSKNGRIFFTVKEPFGEYLRKKFGPNYQDLADKYCYDSLYTLTKTGAEEYADKNKYLISGYYKSQSGSEISLNALNVPQGSVIVTAGGVPLTENVDYTVDYTLGRVRIINEGILNSGTPINISMESNTLFSIQTKRMMGAHIDFDVSRDFHIGGTILNLHERPLTQKVNYGDDPISNTIWGMDYSYQTESRFITKLVDKLPFISTSAVSNVTIDGEFAQFIPGISKATGQGGVSYIDDFEGAKSTIDLRSYNTWFLGSTPQHQADLFPEANYYGTTNSILYGFNRAKTAWYIIDPSVFYDRTSNITPENIDVDELSNNYVRQVSEQEVFPDKEIPNGTPTNIGILNVAYYPEIRGQNNYDAMPTNISAGVNADGTLAEPESRWGGIMRRIETPDFEAANIEYIEFWMMDPFMEGTPNVNLTGGDLYFNLGSISEDILKDSRKSYENGLPTSDDFEESAIINTVWGRIPNQLDLVPSFSSETGSRQYQDVGYDGLQDVVERTYFTNQSEYDSAYPYLDTLRALYGENSIAYRIAYDDPSSDNYRNYRGEVIDTDPAYSSILKKYIEYNGTDGNSPESQGDQNVYDGNSRQPNTEDINDDNTLSEGERYFQYKIQLQPDQMKVGSNYITDILEESVKLANGESTTGRWYQFKIPVNQPDKIVGGITDFKSIRFMRMFLKEFEEPIVLRFATLDLVRGEWRRYTESEDLLEPNVYLTHSDINAKVFDLSAVNTDENGSREPIIYVKPPGIEDEINLGTTNLIRLNEQSLVLNVCELADGDAAGAYKTSDLDFRQFKYLKMFVHAEKSKAEDVVKYGDLTVFMRLGSDFTQNYYEYEIPLTFTQWGAVLAPEIWPETNEFIIDLEQLANFKLQRNTAMQEDGSDLQLFQPYIGYDGVNKVTVFGSPSLSDVQAIMIGVRNPKKTSANDEDDGDTKCAEIWVDELRLTDYNKKSGWATTGRISMNLADLGNVAFSGLYSSPYFASLDTKITDIELDATKQFDIATNIELGKFFPQKAGVRIPLHFDYGQVRIDPLFNPLDPDLLLNDVIDSYGLQSDKDAIKSLTVDYTQRNNFNLMNVRKDRVGAQEKPMFYDIENFDLSYSYSKIYHRNVDIDYDVLKNYMGGLGYNYSANPKNVKPFEKIGFIANTKALQIIKDFNFYYLPKMFSFRTTMTRKYNERLLRNKSFGDVIIDPTYSKNWDWDRVYDLKFDLAQSLTFNFNANALTFIDEYYGSNKVTLEGDSIIILPEDKKQRVKDEIMKGGTKKSYAQTAGINWNIPINKIPLFDWVTGTFGYNISYNWTASPKDIQAAIGNTIANNKNWNINGNADMNKLYNKVPFLKKINEPKRKRPSKKPPVKKPEDPNDSTKVEKPKVNYAKIAYESIFKILMSVKKVTIQYAENTGTALPGFMPMAGILGNDWSNNAPGMDFIFGYQPDGPEYFNKPGWLSNDVRLNTAFSQSENTTFNLRFTLEPFKDFKIEINADRTYAANVSSFYKWDIEDEIFNETNRIEMGSYSMSFITWGTAFGGSLADEKSAYFQNMLDYRIDISNRLADEDPRNNPIIDSTGYPQGYSATSQDVLLPSFIAAYSNKSPETVTLEPFPTIPLPNWRLSYSGLSKIPFLQGIFKSVTVNHAYTCTYNVGSFKSNAQYTDSIVNGIVVPNSINTNTDDYIAKFDFLSTMITEQFSPLINFDMTLQNSMLARFEISKSRNLSLSFANNQLTEVTSNEFSIGLGYRFKDVPISFASMGGGKGRTFKSDLNIKGDFSIRDTKTVLRGIDSDINQVSAGQKVSAIDISIDYMLSQSLTLRLFFNRVTTNPFLPSSYRNSATKGGFSLRFSLAQ